MQSFSSDFTGTDGGPPSTEAYKRAVYKQPPRHFAVQVLPPQKHGNAYSYGMLISPLRDSHDRHSILSRTSDNSNGSSGSSSGSQANSATLSTLDTSTTAPLTTDYEVWRRWEDCLYFQDLLEVQYGIMSREKRARLHAGKGVKKNGLYAHEDPVRRLHRAASFESLPPGPDPTMIAKDVHEVLPRLTKKGTLFKASKETVEQRGTEFRALIEALLSEGEDVPTLITELRQLRVVRDFFGFWRRDQDRLEKQFPKSQDSDKFSMRGRSDSLGSRASSVFSSVGVMGMYFSASNLSLQLPGPTLSPEPSPSPKGPRRPAFMQGGKGAMLPVSPSNNEPGPSKESTTPRRRAQTLQGITTLGYEASTSYSGMNSASSGNDMQTFLVRPPASAPAGISFAAAMEGGYSSDSASASGSPTFPQVCRSPAGSPRPPHTWRSSQTSLEMHYNDATLMGGINMKGKSRNDEDVSGPIIVSLEEGESLPFDEDEDFLVSRDHGRLIPHESIETRLGGGRGLQDLTIKEEDERDYDEDYDGSQCDYPQSDYQASESSAGHGTRGSVESEEEPQSPASHRIRRTAVQSFNRLGMFFRPPSFADSDAASISDNQTISNTERPKSPALSSRSQTPVSSARVAAAHADALRALTGGRPSSPPSARYLAPSDASARSSILTTTSRSGSGSGSTSGSTNSGHARSSDTQSSVDVRPYSYQSSIASCVDIDRQLTSSPVILHSPLLEDFDGDDHSTDQRQSSANASYRTHDSVSSVKTFMTDTSEDVIIPPREQRPVSPRPASSSSTGWKPDGSHGSSLMRSRSSNSRSSGRMSQMTTVSESQSTVDGEDLLDSYFYGVTSPSNESEEDATNGLLSPGREHVRGSLARSDKLPKPFQNRSPGQFNPPWAQQRPTSPSLPVSVRSSVMPMDSSLSIPTSISSSVSSVNAPQSASSYAPSFVSSLTEEANANAVSIKVVCGEQIVAFRIDRNSSLADVREKLRHKLVDQQGVRLADHFALAYKPLGPCRVQELRATAGRARSSSVSSVGATDPSSLRVLFSQRDWLDAVGSCAPSSKVTLHVLNR